MEPPAYSETNQRGPPPQGYPVPQQPPPMQQGYPPPQQGYPHPQQAYAPHQQPAYLPQPVPQPQIMTQQQQTTVVVAGGGGGQNVVVQTKPERFADKICLNIVITIFFWPWIIVWILMCIFET